MATTTNYGWTTPDDTALVKDGASAIRSLGSSIDTTTKNLNPGTTNGDLDYYSTANTKARLAIGSTGQSLTVSGGLPSWQPSPTSVLTSTGDLLFASAANTLARRAIGSTGDVLTVSGGVPTWAAPSSGSITLISTTTLSGVTTTLSSIPQTYQHLYLVVRDVTGNTSNADVRILPNNVNNLSGQTGTRNSTAFGDTGDTIRLSCYQQTLRTNSANAWSVFIYNYTSTAVGKHYNFVGQFIDAASVNFRVNVGGFFNSTSAVSSLVLDYGGTNSFAGGTVLLYGVK